MPDPHVNLTLTFRTDAEELAVAMAVITALGQASVPYKLTAVSLHGFDLDQDDERPDPA